MNYSDFDLKISPGEGTSYRVAVVQSKAGKAEIITGLPYDEQGLRSQLQLLQNALLKSTGSFRAASLPEEPAVVEFGQMLFGAVFRDDVYSLFTESRADAKRRGKGLRIRINCTAPELISLPWEFLCDPARGDFLALKDTTPIIRQVDAPYESRPLRVARPPLRILGIVASPKDYAPINVTAEMKSVEQALEQPTRKGLIELKWAKQPTLSALRSEIKSGPWHIFHFVGHGDFVKSREEGWIYLCDEDNQAKSVPAGQLARALVENKTLRLVVLNSCHGAKSGSLNMFSSTASILVHQGLPAVIAMQHAITESAAIVFSRTFYESLAEGASVDGAMTEARKSISFAFTHTLEWGTPVIYTSATDLRMLPARSWHEEPAVTSPIASASVVDAAIHESREPNDVASDPPSTQDADTVSFGDVEPSAGIAKLSPVLEADVPPAMITTPDRVQTEPSSGVLHTPAKVKQNTVLRRRLLFGILGLLAIGAIVLGAQQFYVSVGGSQAAVSPSASVMLTSTIVATDPINEGEQEPISVAAAAQTPAATLYTQFTTAASTPIISVLGTLRANMTATRIPTLTNMPTAAAQTATLLQTEAVPGDGSIPFSAPDNLSMPDNKVAPVVSNEVRLNFPVDGSFFGYPNSPVFNWSSTEPLAAGQHYLLKIVHGLGTDIHVLDETQWTPEIWMLNTQPEDGVFRWQAAICQGGSLGSYDSLDKSECQLVSDFTQPAAFQWRLLQPQSVLPPPVFVTPES